MMRGAMDLRSLLPAIMRGVLRLGYRLHIVTRLPLRAEPSTHFVGRL